MPEIQLPPVDHDAPDHDRAYCMTCDNRSDEACPATGRSAVGCTDQTHTACWTGRADSLTLDRTVEAEFRRLDGSY